MSVFAPTSVVRHPLRVTDASSTQMEDDMDTVVHFEISGSDPARLRRFYSALFGWDFDTSGTVSSRVSVPDDYGFVSRPLTGTGHGIPGGVGGGPGYPSRAMFYVGVADVEAALVEAERLGGGRVMGPERAPGAFVIGHLTDPEGSLIGIAALPHV